MSAPDLAALPRLPRDADGPVFAEPWQAQAFALAVQLNRQGIFAWTEWAEALSEQLKAAGPSDDGSRYYECWLAALERLVAAKRLAGAEALAQRKQAWEAAYRRTPHGKPVTL
ncbi:MAG: nitrile hydratase accessory protein [Alphaproteobacteria bacterium]|nr:nitrile hydratase accessory protein [Alphaproteobacteria bacterium]